jgi:hypothetical protein
VERDINVRPGGRLTLQPGVTLRWTLLLSQILFVHLFWYAIFLSMCLHKEQFDSYCNISLLAVFCDCQYVVRFFVNMHLGRRIKCSFHWVKSTLID